MEDFKPKQFDYLQALNELDYVFEGAMIPYVLLGETARRVKGVEQLEGLPEIEIGVLKRTMNSYVDRTFTDRWNEWKDKTVRVLNVPVKIKYIQRNYKFFDNLDTVTYYAGTFNIGNPFDKYFKTRHLIK